MDWMMLLAWLLTPSICRVHVEGMPIPQMRHHQIRVGNVHYPAAGVVEVDARGGSSAQLHGVRYEGEVVLPEVCREVLVVEARPLPATVSFTSLPKEAVVSCRNCGWPREEVYLPAYVPAIVVERWTSIATFEIKAAGYEPLQFRQVVHPGPNIVTAQLERRSAFVP